jgi:hypothetical protein
VAMIGTMEFRKMITPPQVWFLRSPKKKLRQRLLPHQMSTVGVLS